MKSPQSKPLLLAFVATMLASLSAMALGPDQPAPPFSLPSQGGGSTSLAEFAGHLVYLDFWASWCSPCRQSFPWMNEIQAKYAGRGLRVLAVNVDAKQSDAEGFLAQVPAQFTVAFDPKGQTPGLYQVKGMPTSFLIGSDGKVLMVHQSFHDGDRKELEASIEAALGVHPEAKP
ncbi:TlpA family protein disulfide reductase [Nevskia soli]|uniref:TlpA family protein disulfide reductase n=1 Tax=Nevskia soli TaxID=418856 RepID=UPI0004A754BE|nr:TlpA disulfide reductase family protein [Nevskia soli]